jgi:hypothetical protein
MAQYEPQEEQIVTGQEMFRMAKITKHWDYLQGKFKIDLEVFVNSLLEADRAGKARWTDTELFKLTIRDAQEKARHGEILDNAAKGTA